jgi:F0F1-type ATP synthase membrane subunit a
MGFFTRCLLYLVVLLHLFIVFGNLAAFFIVPFKADWFIAIPTESIIVYLTFNRNPCPLTVLENHLREKLGKRQIRGFIGHYIIWPIKRLFRD